MTPELQKIRKISPGLTFQDYRAIRANVGGLIGNHRAQALYPDKIKSQARPRNAGGLWR